MLPEDVSVRAYLFGGKYVKVDMATALSSDEIDFFTMRHAFVAPPKRSRGVYQFGSAEANLGFAAAGLYVVIIKGKTLTDCVELYEQIRAGQILPVQDWDKPSSRWLWLKSLLAKVFGKEKHSSPQADTASTATPDLSSKPRKPEVGEVWSFPCRRSVGGWGDHGRFQAKLITTSTFSLGPNSEYEIPGMQFEMQDGTTFVVFDPPTNFDAVVIDAAKVTRIILWATDTLAQLERAEFIGTCPICGQPISQKDQLVSVFQEDEPEKGILAHRQCVDANLPFNTGTVQVIQSNLTYAERNSAE